MHAEPAEPRDGPTTSDFDLLATSLSEGLNAQLGSLRAIVVEAEAARSRDTDEIESTHGGTLREKSRDGRRETALSDRNETITTMQHALRELADSIARASSSSPQTERGPARENRCTAPKCRLVSGSSRTLQLLRCLGDGSRVVRLAAVCESSSCSSRTLPAELTLGSRRGVFRTSG